MFTSQSTTVEVLFNNSSNNYSAGDVVLGRIVAKSDKESNLRLIKGLRVRCKGISTIDLQLGKTSEDTTSASVVYFINEDAKLFVDKMDKSSYEDENGVSILKYECPFRYELPKDLPSSFKTTYGRMEYIMKATLPSGVKCSYFEGRGCFSVVGICDLKKFPTASHPVEMKEHAKIGYLWFGSGIVDFRIFLPKRGYAIGETIRLHQEITNETNSELTAQTTLIQHIHYNLKSLIRLDKKNKIQVWGRPIPAGVTDVCDEDVFDIPNVPVTSDINLKADFKTVKINYFLQCEVINRSLLSKTLKVEIPIFVGSTPITKKINTVATM